MTTKTSPAAALLSIREHTGAIYRHGPSEDGREFIGLATRLDTGVWATTWDRGAYGGKVYGEHRGTHQVIDLFLHIRNEDGSIDELPLRWATQTAVRPIMLIGVPGDTALAPQPAPAAEMCFPEYQHIHRPVIVGAERFDKWQARASLDATSAPFEAKQGSIYDFPMNQWYRNGADDDSKFHTTCIHADMDYPTDLVLGGPVVDDAGRLVGVIIGADLGPERSHTGAYVDIDTLRPCVALTSPAYQAARGRGYSSFGMDFVEHYSNEVNFLDHERPRPSRHRRDDLIRVVLPRHAWNALASSEGPDAPGYNEAVSAIADAAR